METRSIMERMTIQIMRTLSCTIDAKDRYTNGHSTRVAEYSWMIAERAGYHEKELKDLFLTAMLHDIGKIGIPDQILCKTSPLTEEEYAIIKTHPVIGEQILKNITEMPGIAIGARWHHERYDGKGYPDGLQGKEIPETARIIGVADAYDAMTSNRTYRRKMAQEEVRGQIVRGRGTQFDPQFADIMLQLMAEDTDYKMHG